MPSVIFAAASNSKGEVSHGSALNLATWTVAMWIKRTGLGDGDYRIVNKAASVNAGCLQVTGWAGFDTGIRGRQLTTSGSAIAISHNTANILEQDVWVCVFIQYNQLAPQTVRIYKYDGVSAIVESAYSSVVNNVNGPSFNTVNLYIGNNDVNNQGFDGKLAYLVIDDTAWDSATMLDYATGTMPAANFLWELQDNSLSQPNTGSVAGFTMTLTNTTYDVADSPPVDYVFPGAANINAVPMLAAADLNNPTVSISGVANVTAVPMLASADLNNPTITGGSGTSVVAEVMAAQARSYIPQIEGNVTLSAPGVAFLATAAFGIPTIFAGNERIINAVPMLASADLNNPSLTNGATITAVAMAATADLNNPQVTGAASNVFVSDTFTRADAAVLGNAETGQAWSATDWGITNNRARRGSGSVNATITTGATGEYFVEVDGFPADYSSGTQLFGVLARYADDSNLILWERVLVPGVEDAVKLYVQVAGNFVERDIWGGGPGETGLDVNENLKMRIEIIGLDITCYVNGIVRANHTLTGPEDAALGTQAGMRSEGSYQPLFDNFLVAPNEVTPVYPEGAWETLDDLRFAYYDGQTIE